MSAAAKYVAVAAIAVRQSLASRAVLLGRTVFYVLLLLIFSRLWRVVLAGGGTPSVGASEMLWYLAVTEWVMIGTPLPHQEVERDVRSGEIAYGLARPLSYVGRRVAENVGALLVRLLVLGVVGFAAAWLLAGGLPADPRGLLLAVPLGILSGVVWILFGTAIGVTAFWLKDASPVYWVWQKLAFVLGGLILPLSVYPAWLREAAAFTPFAALLHGPGRSALGFAPAEAAATGGLLLLWGAVAAGLLAALYRAGLKTLDLGGG